MYGPIIEFFEKKKLFELSSDMSDQEKLQIIKNNIGFWLSKRIDQLKNVDLTTHPTNLSHPKAKKVDNHFLTSVIAKCEKRNDGYLCSGNVNEIETDMRITDAKDIPYTQFLNLKIDGEKILWHLEKDTIVIKTIFSGCSETESEKLKLGLLNVNKFFGDNRTGSKLKQVYFPVNKGYHLLSVLMPSGIMFEMRKRILNMKFGEEAKAVKEAKEKNEYCEKLSKSISDLVVIGFGGAQPQNISFLNSNNEGKAYFLSSLPPALSEFKLKLPRHNFFAEILWPGFYKEDLSALHKLFKTDINNVDIRRGRDDRILSIFDDIVRRIWAIRSSEIGWSTKERCAGLPQYQKIILDDFYLNIRFESEESIHEFISDIARWIIKAYQKNAGADAVKLADDELSYIYKLIEEQSEVL